MLFSFAAGASVLIALKLSRVAAVTLSAAFSIVFSALVYKLSSARRIARGENVDERVNALMDKLNVCTYDEIFAVFRPIFNRMRINTRVADDYMILRENVLVKFSFRPDNLSANELYLILKDISVNNYSVVVLARGFTPDALSFAKKRGVKVFGASRIYDFLKDNSSLPELELNEKKPFYDGLFARLFQKTNGVKFILFGLSLVAMAFIVFFPIYYYICGGAFVVFGAACLILGKKPFACDDDLGSVLVPPKSSDTDVSPIVGNDRNQKSA